MRSSAAPLDEGGGEPHAERAEEDGLEHRTVVLHREELREEVRLTDAEEGPHDDHGRIVLPGIGVVVARELQVVRVHGRELGVDGLEAAAELERDEESRHGRDHHQHALNDVGHHDRADAARHAVEDDGDAHHDDADPLRSARVGREDHARTHRLRANHGHEEDEHQDGEQAADGGRLITIGKIVGHREHLVAMAELDEPAADEKRRNDHRKGDARHRDAHACIAYMVDRARHAHEGRHRILRREIGKA